MSHAMGANFAIGSNDVLSATESATAQAVQSKGNDLGRQRVTQHPDDAHTSPTSDKMQNYTDNIGRQRCVHTTHFCRIQSPMTCCIYTYVHKIHQHTYNTLAHVHRGWHHLKEGESLSEARLRAIARCSMVALVGFHESIAPSRLTASNGIQYQHQPIQMNTAMSFSQECDLTESALQHNPGKAGR